MPPSDPRGEALGRWDPPEDALDALADLLLRRGESADSADRRREQGAERQSAPRPEPGAPEAPRPPAPG